MTTDNVSDAVLVLLEQLSRKLATVPPADIAAALKTNAKELKAAIREMEKLEQENNVPDDLREPDWNAAGRIHDWRNHISDNVRAMWHTFTPVQRNALFEQASDNASNEEWE